MKTWVIGSIVGFLVGLLFIITAILLNGQFYFIDILALWPPFLLVIIFSIFGSCGNIVCQLEGISWVQFLTTPVAYGLIGIFIGRIMNKIKSKKPTLPI